MQTVKYSIRKLFQEGGATRRIGRRSNPAVPLEGAYIPVQLPGETKARVALIEDVFSDSPAFFLVMVKSKAFGIVPGTAVYNESNKLVSASVIWADGTPGEVGYEYTDANGSYVFTASKTTGSATPKIAREIVTRDGDGNDIGTITGEEGTAVTLVAQPLSFTAKQNDLVSLTENTGMQKLTFSPLTAKVQIISEAHFEVSADGNTWSFFAEVDPLVSNNFYVRIKDTSTPANLTGKLHFQVEGTLAGECALTGHVGDGTESYPYPVANASQLDDVRNDLSAHYAQYADIELKPEDNWVPLGQFGGVGFDGAYDGGGHQISNLYCLTTGSDNGGLFGRIYDAAISNLTLRDFEIISAANAGALAGSVYPDSGESTDRSNISNVSCINCFVHGVSGSGGLAGYVMYSNIVNCHVINLTTPEANIRGGGLTNYSFEVSISRCSASGIVYAQTVGGGITATLSSSSLNNCRSECSVIGTGAGVFGGLIGLGDGMGDESMHYCVMTGSVTGDGLLGAIDGNADEATLGLDPASYTELYFDKDISGTESLNNVGEGISTADMTTGALITFSAYDTDIWDIVAGVYPKLKGEKSEA